MVKVRIIYSKTKESIYLSHLDMIRVFERSFRRANIIMDYSNGFSPKPEMVFAHPLSVGIESNGEILEVVLVDHIPIEYVIKEVNKVLPKSITILSAQYVDLHEQNIMARVYGAIYLIEFIVGREERITDKELSLLKLSYCEKMQAYLSQEFIQVLKKSENRNERIDIKPLIHSFSFTYDHHLEIIVDAGSKSNLKPDYIMEGFKEYIDVEQLKYHIKREKILFDE